MPLSSRRRRSPARGAARAARSAMRVGLILSRTGPAGMWAPICDACTMLAAAEVNARGGVLDREVELVLADTGLTGASASAAASHLVTVDEVDAVIGMHPSDTREAVKAGIAGRAPYVYAPMYEGGERGANVVAIGGTDAELMGPAIPYLVERRRAERFFLVGNDYVWPWRAFGSARTAIGAAGGRVVGAALMPLGTEDYEPIMAAIRRAAPDVVLMFLLGEETARFNRAFTAAGLGARMLRFGLAIDETVLYAMGPDCAENLYVASTFLAHTPSARGDRFRELYRASFGERAPPATVFGQLCYDSLHLLAQLAESGRRPDSAALSRHFARLAGGRTTRHTLPSSLIASTSAVHVAEARGTEFRILSSH